MKVLELQTETEKELAAVAAELAIENRKLRIALNAARENLNVKEVKFYKGDPPKEFVSSQTSFPAIDPLATDPRHIV